MNYEISFTNYMNALILESASSNSKKMYKLMRKELIKLKILMFKERKITDFKIAKLQDDLMLVENDLVNNELPYCILQSTCNRPPKGYKQLILKYKGKSNKIWLYFQLLNSLKNVIEDFYKFNKTDSIYNLFILQSLLKVIEDSYQYDLVVYEEQINNIIEILKKDEIPYIERLDNVYELIKFIDYTLKTKNGFELKRFQESISKIQ